MQIFDGLLVRKISSYFIYVCQTDYPAIYYAPTSSSHHRTYVVLFSLLYIRRPAEQHTSPCFSFYCSACSDKMPRIYSRQNFPLSFLLRKRNIYLCQYVKETSTDSFIHLSHSFNQPWSSCSKSMKRNDFTESLFEIWSQAKQWRASLSRAFISLKLNPTFLINS